MGRAQKVRMLSVAPRLPLPYVENRLLIYAFNKSNNLLAKVCDTRQLKCTYPSAI